MRVKKGGGKEGKLRGDGQPCHAEDKVFLFYGNLLVESLILLSEHLNYDGLGNNRGLCGIITHTPPHQCNSSDSLNRLLQALGAPQYILHSSNTGQSSHSDCIKHQWKHHQTRQVICFQLNNSNYKSNHCYSNVFQRWMGFY